MTIINARKTCDELQAQIKIVEENYILSEGYAKYVGEKEVEPLYNEWSNLMSLINKAEKVIDI